MSRSRSVVPVLVLAGALLAAGLHAPAGAAVPVGVPAPVPVLQWEPCPEAPGYECTTAVVPLDHDEPAGDTVALAVTRRPASGPESERLGSLFLNPGGPGGSGVGFTQAVGDFLYSDEVRARFDLVGFDPRGVAGSTPLQCFATTDDAVAALPPVPFPVTPEEDAAWAAGDRRYVQSCKRHAGPVLDHMSTADVARDMDLLRAAVGDEQLTFAGYSYGSYIASTYAALFPGRVRAVVADGVIDPVATATGDGKEAKTLPVDARLESEQGASQTLQELLRLCKEGADSCAFSDGDPHQRFAALAERLRAEPVTFSYDDGSSEEFGYASLIGLALGTLYDPQYWGPFTDFLQYLDSSSPAAATQLRELRQAQQPPEDAQPYDQVLEGFLGVWCSDNLNPHQFSHWPVAADAADARWPYFGRAWIMGSSTCADWPGKAKDRHLGPFDRATSTPLLVIGNRFDPATRYEDAVSTAARLPGAALLTLEGWGHTSLFLSSCIDGQVSRYLLEQELPEPGATCAPDRVPYAGSGLRTASAAAVRPPGLFAPPRAR